MSPVIGCFTEDLDEDIWDIDDDDYYFEQERDRFDTAGLLLSTLFVCQTRVNCS